MVTPEYIESTQRSLALLHQLVTEVLRRDRDYGHVRGIPGEFLWDPGASQIIAAFNCHVGSRRILSLVDDGKKIALLLEVPIIHNVTQSEVGSGIGAASTLETKHKYRWVEDPQEWGYPEDSIKTLKTKVEYEKSLFRILNPEHDELLNTLAKMASKRAEVDAAEALPGVAGALKDLFEHRPPPSDKRPEVDDSSPRWTSFWSQVKALLGDIAEEQKGVELRTLVHQMLGVSSMKDWLSKGKSLDDAVRVLADKVKKTKSRTKSREEWEKVTQEEVTTFGELEAIFTRLTSKPPEEMYKELGVSGRNDMTTPVWEAYLQLKETFAPAESKS
jgi:hypothetical protein